MKFLKKILKQKKGFTFMELVVAIAIVTIAVAGSLVDAKATIDQSKIARAKDEVQQLNLATQRYYTDMSAYPAALADLTSASGGKGPWMKKVNASDPWGTAWDYNTATGEVTSFGPDKATGGTDDIKLSTL